MISLLPPPTLRFIVPTRTSPIARALVERFAYIAACPIVDPDVARLSRWLAQRTGHVVTAELTAEDAIEDLEVCMASLETLGAFALGTWQPSMHGGMPTPGGYVMCDGNGCTHWATLPHHALAADDASRSMRLAGLGSDPIEQAQNLITRSVI